MERLVEILRSDYPQITFIAGQKASWLPAKKQITYTNGETGNQALWTMLHELGHGLLEHTTYTSDAQLLKLETAAWQRATELVERYKVSPIDEDHVQECLDTYRDWLHKRSTCPHCGNHGIQASQSLYICINCQNTWKVSSARFCRPYRLTKPLTTK
jgi:hypothetical protein